MDRRESLRRMMMASGALIALPSWAHEWSKASLESSPSAFSVAEGELLSSVADTIIPAGNSIGALTVGVDKYLQKLIDDCYETPVQDNVKKQLRALKDQSFIASPQQEREKLLMKLANSGDKDEKDFFTLIKSET